MNKKLTTILIITLALGIGYLAGRVLYSKKYDQLSAEMGLKKQMLWELGKKGDILGRIKDGKYRKAFEIERELKAKQFLFKKEFDKRLTKVRWAAWGAGGAVSLFLALLGIILARFIHKGQSLGGNPSEEGLSPKPPS